MNESNPNRREFLQHATAAIAAGAIAGCNSTSGERHSAAMQSALQSAKGIALVSDPNDPIATADPAHWAVCQLRASLQVRKLSTDTFDDLSQVPPGFFPIVASAADRPVAKRAFESIGNFLKSTGTTP